MPSHRTFPHFVLQIGPFKFLLSEKPFWTAQLPFVGFANTCRDNFRQLRIVLQTSRLVVCEKAPNCLLC